MKAHPTSRSAGFTLVEILVTIAIIIVLAGGIFALSRKGVQAANSASTLGNLREIGAGVGGWMADNGNYFPPAWDNTEGRNRSYAQVLDPYVNGEENYRKPDSRFISPNARLKVKVNEYSHPITYSMNHVVCEVYNRPEDLENNLIHVTQVDRLNDVILMADGCQNPNNLNQANATFYQIQVGKTGSPAEWAEEIPVGPDVDEGKGDGWIRYPGGKAHALMCDGSARVFTKGSITKANIWIDRVRGGR